ncbi:MAG: hypothetical protein M0P13_03850 [Fibrobacteraceae bacterium]|nr:hypothetical protein [Fibrobacteraceae bacterium]
MREEIDFSKASRLVPRKDSWDKVVMRINKANEQKESLLLNKFSSLSAAASILFVAGAMFFGFNSNSTATQTSASDSSFEYFSWYSGLGSGNAVSSFSTAIDNYFPTGG